MKKVLQQIIGGIFTIWGVYLLIWHKDLTNGFLAIIAGELIDLEYRIKGASSK